MSSRSIEVPSSLALNGLHSGVPTNTTPTLTPTTLRYFKQTLIDVQNDMEPHENQARFVPPPLDPVMSQNSSNIFMSYVDTKNWQGSTVNNVPLTSFPIAESPPIQTQQNQDSNPPKKSTGGRRPIKDKSISPEEERRRQVRRERNKQAAARCRERRANRLKELSDFVLPCYQETDDLEGKKQSLQDEITALQQEKEDLENLLESHEPACLLKTACTGSSNHLSDSMDVKPPALFIKPDPDSDLNLPLKSKLDPILSSPLLSQQSTPKPFSNQRERPNSLAVSGGFIPSIPVSAATVMPSNLNFESLMDGGTGLTPVSGPLVPSCSSQLRNSGCVDLSSPDSASSKLVSL